MIKIWQYIAMLLLGVIVGIFIYSYFLDKPTTQQAITFEKILNRKSNGNNVDVPIIQEATPAPDTVKHKFRLFKRK